MRIATSPIIVVYKKQWIACILQKMENHNLHKMENRNLQKLEIFGQPHQISQFTDNNLRYWPWRHQFSARSEEISQFTDLLRKIAIIAIIAKIANIAIYAVPTKLIQFRNVKKMKKSYGVDENDCLREQSFL